MKTIYKVILLAMMSIATIGVKAQSPISFEARVGGNLSYMRASQSFGKASLSANTDNKYGFNVGALVNYNFTKQWFVQSGLEFTTKGAKTKSVDDNFNAYKMSVNAMYLQVPIRAGFKAWISDDIALVFSAGPYLACGVGGKIKVENAYESGKGNTFSDGNFKRFDFGLGLNAGAEFDRFTTTIGYNMGLIDVTPKEVDGKLKNHNFYLSLGYKFSL